MGSPARGWGGPPSCDDCGGEDLVFDPSTTDTVCRSCGRVASCGSHVAGFSDLERTGRPSAPDSGGGEFLDLAGGGPGCARALGRAMKITRAGATTAAETSAARDSAWIRQACQRCGLPQRVEETASEIARSLSKRPYWVPRKNNNLLGVRLACIYHATIIEECPKDYKLLADAAGVPRRSAKNMISVTQSGHDDVARRFFRGCGHRSWPAKVSTDALIPGMVSEVPWIKSETARRLISECRKTSEKVGAALDNHCPKTIVAGVVAYSIWSSESLTRAAASDLTAGASEACELCAASAVSCCENHVRMLEGSIAATAGVAVATMRQTCESARQAIDALSAD